MGVQTKPGFISFYYTNGLSRKHKKDTKLETRIGVHKINFLSIL